MRIAPYDLAGRWEASLSDKSLDAIDHRGGILFANRFSNLRPYPLRRIEITQRILKNHGESVVAPEPAQRRSGYIGEIYSPKIHLALRSGEFDIGKQLEYGTHKGAFTRSGFTNDADALAFSNREIDSIDGTHDRSAYPQMYHKIS